MAAESVASSSGLQAAASATSLFGLPTGAPAASDHVRSLRKAADQGTISGAPSRKNLRVAAADDGEEQDMEEDGNGGVPGVHFPAARPAGEAVAASGGTNGSLKEMCGLTAQMALQANYAAQTARSCCTDLLLMKRASRAVVACKAATKQYSETVTKLSATAKAAYHPPFVVVWEALVQVCLAIAGEKAMVEHVAAITGLVTTIGGFATPATKMEFLFEVIKCCRVSPAFNKEDAKLEVCVKSAGDPASLSCYQAWKAMKQVLVTEGAIAKAGMAPKSNVERKLGRMMAKMGVGNKPRTPGEW